MRRQTIDPSSGNSCGPGDLRFLDNPLDFIAEGHLREREICALMDRIAAQDVADEQDLIQVQVFLKEELLLHLQDEGENLFPLMLERCTPDDEIEKVITRLLAGHCHAVEDIPKIISVLEAAFDKAKPLTKVGRIALIDFAAKARRHLILENAIILPIARARLKPRDLDGLRHAMLTRRGLD